jgi:hypothetical protein
MAIKDEKFSIHEVNSLLFQIISFMSEEERDKLQELLTARLPHTRNGEDLSSLIADISEAKRCELLKRLADWYIAKVSHLAERSTPVESRGYPRESLKIPVELSKNGFIFQCSTQNISKSGVFIKTDFRFHIDQKVNMNFSPPKINKEISVGGKVIRVGSSGIGVKFDRLMPAFWHMYYQNRPV